MGKLKSAGRKLDPRRVQMAEQAFYFKHELAMKMVHERVKKDADFAADVLKVARNNLRPEILEDARKTVLQHTSEVESLKAVNVNVPVTPEVISAEKLREGLQKLSEKQDERLKAAGLLPETGEQCGGDGCLCQNH